MTPGEFEQRMHATAAAGAAPTDLMQRIVLKVEAQVKGVTPVRTGNLRRSITGRVETASRGIVGTNVEYAKYVEYGTRYQQGQHYMETGLQNAQADIAAILAAAGKRTLDEIGR